MSTLLFSRSTHDNWSVLSVEGQIDSKSVGDFQESLAQMTDTSQCIAVDLTKVSFMSSAGLRALLVVHKQTSSQAKPLVFIGINDDIKDVMRVTGFLQHFTLISTCEDLPTNV
jgi:anti-sigma B factor antagonist